MTRVCNKCLTPKPLEDFAIDKTRKLGRQYSCKICKRKATWVSSIVKDYDLTEAEYHAILDKQGMCCAVCKKKPTPSRRLCVDHNHLTGEVRGLLCDRCNRGIGLLGDSAEAVYAAYRYLGG